MKINLQNQDNIVIEVFFLPPSSPIQPPVIVQADIGRVIIAICWILTPHWQRDIKKQNDYQLGLHFYFAPCTWTNTVETNRPFVQIRRALITVFCRLWMKSGIWRCWCILTVLLNIKWALWGQWATLFFERLLKLTSTQHKPSNFEIKRISLSSLHWKYPPEKACTQKLLGFIQLSPLNKNTLIMKGGQGSATCASSSFITHSAVRKFTDHKCATS